MSKKHFIALADAIREHNRVAELNGDMMPFCKEHLSTLVDFCRAQNPQFKHDRWLGYIAGTNGRNGGKVAA